MSSPPLRNKAHVNVAFLTSGGLAPCLSSSLAALAQAWIQALEKKEIGGLTLRCYLAGYKGLLLGESIIVPNDTDLNVLHEKGGSPIGNSRVKLTNTKDCIAKGYVPENTTPLEVASQQLLKDEIHVLHTIGGDDTNTQAASLSEYLLKNHQGQVIVIGMPKTIDNDVYPIRQTFGADTAAEQGALYFANVVNESTANPKMLILHECMGRDSGYLTAATARKYRETLLASADVPFPLLNKASSDIHAIWIPELELDLQAEAQRLTRVMDEQGCVNIFFAEGTGVHEIVAAMEQSGMEVPRDAFGHVSLAKVNPGDYFLNNLKIGAQKTLVQKSGYFARSAAPNVLDRQLIQACANNGIQAALDGISGCMGEDEDAGNTIRPIEFHRIKGGKPFDVQQEWFQKMLKDIGQI